MRLLSRNLWRLFWVAMFVLHAPGWGATCAEWSATGVVPFLRLSILTTSLVLFTLKIADVRWLRLPYDRRAYLLVTVVIVLLHGNVVQRLYVEDREAHNVAYPAILVSVAATAATAVRRLPRQLLYAIRPRASQRQAREILNDLLSRVEQLALSPRCFLMVCPCPVNRAPPR